MRLGEILLKNGDIDSYQLQSKLIRQKDKYPFKPIGKLLLEKKLITKDILIKTLAEQNSTTGVNILSTDVDPLALSTLTKQQAYRYNVLPFRLRRQSSGKILHVATSNPRDISVLQEISFIAGYPVEPVYALKEDISTAITLCYNRLKERS